MNSTQHMKDYFLSPHHVNSNVSLNSQTLKAKDLFLAINYNPKLGPFTDTWDDLVDDFGSKLHFGKISYQNNYVSRFQERVKPRDVKAALVLLSYLKLEHHTIDIGDSLLFDSSMLLIKASSEGANVHNNSFGKPNSMFAWFVIDFLSMLILFDTFIDHRSLIAPMPFTGVPLTPIQSEMFLHNKNILIKFCVEHGNSNVSDYFVIKKTGEIKLGKNTNDMNQLWGTSTKYHRQLKAGIVSSFESYKESYTGDKKVQKMWIHHFVILQLFHPLFRFYPGDDSAEIDFHDDNHHLFIAKMNEDQIKMYIKTYGETPNFSWLWLGEGGKL